MSDYIDYSYKASSQPKSNGSARNSKSARKPVNYDDDDDDEQDVQPAKGGKNGGSIASRGKNARGTSKAASPPSPSPDEDDSDDVEWDEDDSSEDAAASRKPNYKEREQKAMRTDGGEIDDEGSADDMGYPPQEGGRRGGGRKPSVTRSSGGDNRRKSLGSRQGIVIAGLGGDAAHNKADRPTYVPEARSQGGVGKGRPPGALNPEIGGEKRPAAGVDPSLSKVTRARNERLREQEKDPDGMGIEGVDGDDYDDDDYDYDEEDDRPSGRGTGRGSGRRQSMSEIKDVGYGRQRSSRGQGDYGRGRGAPAYPSALCEHLPPNYPQMSGLTAAYYTFWKIQSFLITSLSFTGLFMIALNVAVFNASNPFRKVPPKPKVDKAFKERITGERYSLRTEYYCKFWGYGCEIHDTVTADGFTIRMYRVTRPGAKPGYPVLLMHGILCNSTFWVVNEERSLPFWLAEQGYDVWIGNIRTNFKTPHKTYSRNDPRYWAWAVREIGIYDHTAMIDYITENTGFPQLAFVGHSQGSGAMFVALANEQRPDIAQKMSCFCALGPAVYAGPVLNKFPFSILRLVATRFLWSKGIGVTEFFPILSLFQTYFPGWLFGHLAFPVFAFMFRFHETYLLGRQFPKLFRGVPVATSSELLFFYMASFAEYGCLFDVSVMTPWFPPGFPPLALFYGTIDYLVLGAPLVERIRKNEPYVPLVRAVALDNYEHLGCEAVESTFYGVRDTIEETRSM